MEFSSSRYRYFKTINIILFLCYISQPDLSLKEVLKRHLHDLIRDNNHPHRITVRLGKIFEDTMTSLCCYNETNPLKVTFLGEPAVDEGGPNRELFMLLMGEIANNGSLLDGSPNNRILRHNTSAFQVLIKITIIC